MTKNNSDAAVVFAPGDDGCLDLLFGELFADSAAGERGQLRVGGEAQADVLAQGEGCLLYTSYGT